MKNSGASAIGVRGAVAMAAVIAAVSVSPARADDVHLGVAVTGGFGGIGADFGIGINDWIGARATLAGFSINHNGDYGTSVSWDAKLKLFQAGALLDVYPFAGGFRLSAGIINDGNKFTLNGQPNGGNFTFNGNSYASSEITGANASVGWSKSVPYLGLGWGNLGGSRGLHFTSDIGILFTGSPSATITVGCAPSVPAATCTQLQSDVQAEQAKMQNDVHKLTVWPVARFGVGFAF